MKKIKTFPITDPSLTTPVIMSEFVLKTNCSADFAGFPTPFVQRGQQSSIRAGGAMRFIIDDEQPQLERYFKVIRSERHADIPFPDGRYHHIGTLNIFSTYDVFERFPIGEHHIRFHSMPLARALEPSKNGFMFKRETLVEICRRFENRYLYGKVGAPEKGKFEEPIPFDEVSHRVYRLRMIEDTLVADIEIAAGPAGVRLLETPTADLCLSLAGYHSIDDDGVVLGFTLTGVYADIKENP